jgi:anti-sigma regulatory factor (Ser/Thr protein kinase)
MVVSELVKRLWDTYLKTVKKISLKRVDLDDDDDSDIPGFPKKMADDFFNKAAHLTVSGQLEGETFACALGNIYTFGPTFRAENSNTSRHAAEFWMIEPEMAFCDLQDDMDLAEDGPVKIHQLLSTLVNDATALSDGRHRITLTLEGPAQIRANSMELQTAVRNLLTNAVRYTPEGGEIEVNWSQHGNEGLISVRDTGIGISAEHLPRLTERFYRVDRGRSRDSGGTGLGLAIVKHSLQRHQASLEISSRLGAGSTFTIRWPASRMIKEATSPPQAQTQENN